MRVEVEQGRVRRIGSQPDNRATPEGVCLKGLSYVERLVSPDRIVTPLRRQAGGFEPIAWSEALELIGDRLRRYREASGPQSVLYYAGSGTKGLLNRVGPDFWRLYGGCTTTYGDLCWPAGLEATRLTLGENKHNVPWDLENARLIVLWGKNPAETNIHQMPFIDRALDRGARLVVIDPRRTQSAERAQLLLQPRPGTDGALALAVGNLLIRQGGIDRRFIDDHVLGFTEYAEATEAYPPERAGAICDLPEAQIRQLAEGLGTLRPATICAGFGLQRYTNSGQAMRGIIALAAITGNIGRSGGGWQFANLQSDIFSEVKDPEAFYPPARPGGRIRVSISTARLGAEMLATRDPALRMAWVERGNPLPQNPQTGKVLEAFRALDFRVVVDQFLTDTAREADIVLPAKTFLEQSDIIGAYWHPYIQLKQKLVEPPGEVKPESEIYRLLARHLGLGGDELDRIFPVGDRQVDAWLEERLAPFPGLDLERLRQGPVVAPGHQEVAFSDHLFPTPSGKLELHSLEAATRWGVEPVCTYEAPRETVAFDGGTDEPYPLMLLTPNTKNRIHSQFGNLRMIRELGERPLATLHPSDARQRRIEDGSAVRIFNGRGEIEVQAALDPTLRPGCVSLPNGFWITEGGAVNFTSSGRETDLGHGAAFHDNCVEVLRIE